MESKRNLIGGISIVIAIILIAIIGFFSYQKMQANYDLQQEINKVRIREKVEYTPKITKSQIEEYKIALTRTLDNYLADTMQSDYEGYKSARETLQLVFFISSGDYNAIGTENHEERVKLRSGFTYEILDVSGVYDNETDVTLFVKMKVRNNGQELQGGEFFMDFTFDNEQRLIGGTMYEIQ